METHIGRLHNLPQSPIKLINPPGIIPTSLLIFLPLVAMQVSWAIFLVRELHQLDSHGYIHLQSIQKSFKNSKKSSPSMTELEMVMTDWLAKAIGLPHQFWNSDSGPGVGMIQSTASDATLVALLAARARAVKVKFNLLLRKNIYFQEAKFTEYSTWAMGKIFENPIY